MVPGVRPGAPQMQNYFMPFVQRPGQQGQRMGNRRSGAPLQPQQHQFLPQVWFHVFCLWFSGTFLRKNSKESDLFRPCREMVIGPCGTLRHRGMQPRKLAVLHMTLGQCQLLHLHLP